MILPFSIQTQPDGVSCGPTCLQAIYHFLGDVIPLETVIKEVPYLDTGGTLAVLLGCHALARGHQATLHSFNLHVLDPSWFRGKNVCLIDKLQQQLKQTTNTKIASVTKAYLQFLDMGGTLGFEEMRFQTIANYIQQGTPLISGVSATYLYQTMRDYTNSDDRCVYDEWLGAPSGHFVTIHGVESKGQRIHIADPYTPHPLSRDHYYQVPFSHWLHAYLLGIMTYDVELLAIMLK
ncbi:MAG: C39 family peptidase [Gammaproteobacteria bacterium]|nr:C39 family peptidase [Gammaproteobacteria bacterium]